MTKNEYEVFKHVAGLQDEKLLAVMWDILSKSYSDGELTEDYLYLVGDIPICLVAHVDTVFKNPSIDIFFDREEQVIWSPDGGIGDDRAGVYAILNLVQKRKLRPHIILTNGEETGGIGAFAITRKYKKAPFDDIRYFVELDRRGYDDCVFYDCENEDFAAHIETFGFKTAIGSFSDISILCDRWKICGVNLSIGYIGEHSPTEILCVDALEQTMDRVEKILKQEDIPLFEWKSSPSPFYYPIGMNYDDIEDDYDDVLCDCCLRPSIAMDTIRVKSDYGNYITMCMDCFVHNEGDWCDRCGEAFIKTANTQTLCNDCEAELFNEYSDRQ